MWSVGLDDFESFAVVAWPRLVRAAVLLGLQLADAQDVAQDALARCYRSWRTVRSADDVWAYTHTVLVNCVRSSLRKRKYVVHPVADPAELEVEVAGEPMDREPLLRAIRRLPEGQREVIALRYFVDLTEEQTADALGISLGTVKSRAHRALRALSTDQSLRELTGGEER